MARSLWLAVVLVGRRNVMCGRCAKWRFIRVLDTSGGWGQHGKTINENKKHVITTSERNPNSALMVCLWRNCQENTRKKSETDSWPWSRRKQIINTRQLTDPHLNINTLVIYIGESSNASCTRKGSSTKTFLYCLTKLTKFGKKVIKNGRVKALLREVRNKAMLGGLS